MNNISEIEMNDRIQEVRNDFLRKLVAVTEHISGTFSNAMYHLEDASSALEFELEEIQEMFEDPEQLTLVV